MWHFPEKPYESEETMRKVNIHCGFPLLIFFIFFCLLFIYLFIEILQCAESALKSVIGDLSNTYFVGNAPMAHMVVQPNEDHSGSSSFKVYSWKIMVLWSTLGRLTSSEIPSRHFLSLVVPQPFQYFCFLCEN